MPAAAVAIPAVISAGTSVAQMVSGGNMARKAQRALDNYERQDLVNPYESLQVSTLGADRMREDAARTSATLAGQAAQGGSRAILGLAPQIIAQQNAQNAQIMANLDQQEAARQQAIAQGDGMVMQMEEQRENADLAGIGNQLNVGTQNQMNGLNNLMQTAATAGTAYMYGKANGIFGGTKTPASPRIPYNPILGF